MTICIEIEMDDSGKFTVGVCPPESDAEENKEYMQPAESLGVALEKARSMFGPKADKPKDMKEAMFGPDKADEKA